MKTFFAKICSIISLDGQEASSSNGSTSLKKSVKISSLYPNGCEGIPPGYTIHRVNKDGVVKSSSHNFNQKDWAPLPHKYNADIQSYRVPIGKIFIGMQQLSDGCYRYTLVVPPSKNVFFKYKGEWRSICNSGPFSKHCQPFLSEGKIKFSKEPPEKHISGDCVKEPLQLTEQIIKVSSK